MDSPPSPDEVVRQMRADVDQLQPTPTDFQRAIIEKAIERTAPQIYGERWRTDEPEIRRRNGWVAAEDGALVGSTIGRSAGLAMAAVIMLLNIRSARVALNGRTIRQACLVLAMAKTILNAHPRAAEFKITTATALSIVVHGGPGDERTLSAGLDSDAIY